jgi:hypothetical protein
LLFVSIFVCLLLYYFSDESVNEAPASSGCRVPPVALNGWRRRDRAQGWSAEAVATLLEAASSTAVVPTPSAAAAAAPAGVPTPVAAAVDAAPPPVAWQRC